MKDSARAVLDALTAGPLSFSKILGATGVTAPQAKSSLAQFNKLGYVTREGDGWGITDLGRQRLERGGLMTVPKREPLPPIGASMREPTVGIRLEAVEAQSDDLALTVADLLARVKRLEALTSSKPDQY